MSDHLFELVIGAYLFAAGSYVFALKVLLLLYPLKKLVTNHHEHRFEDLEKRLDRLEDRRARHRQG
jgi:hypothetical protein